MTQHLTIPVHREHWMTANTDYHHHDRARRRRKLRADTRVLAMALTKVGQVERIVATICYPTARRADPMNAAPTLKPCIDALVDAGVLFDDDHIHLPEVAFRRGPNTKTPGLYRIELELIP